MLNDVLGSLKKYHERTLFGKDAPQKAAGIDGYYVIQISPMNTNLVNAASTYYNNNGASVDVIGLLEKFPEFNINANWTEQGSLANVAPTIPGIRWFLGGIQGASDAMKPLLNRGGIADMGAVYQSKKIYNKSGYLDLSVSFKVINWNGQPQNSPIHVAMTLFSYMLPSEAFNLWEYMKREGIDIFKNVMAIKDKAIAEAEKGDFSMLNSLTSTMNKVSGFGSKLFSGLPAELQSAVTQCRADLGTAWDKVKDVPGNMTEDAKAAAKQLIDNPIDNVGLSGGEILNSLGDAAGIALEYFDDNFMLRKQPGQVMVRIGKFFQNYDMIVENVNVNFSEEMTEEGPLWADFTVKLSSRTIMYDISKMGFKVYANGEWSDVKIQKPDETVDVDALNAKKFNAQVARDTEIAAIDAQLAQLESQYSDLESQIATRSSRGSSTSVVNKLGKSGNRFGGMKLHTVNSNPELAAARTGGMGTL